MVLTQKKVLFYQNFPKMKNFRLKLKFDGETTIFRIKQNIIPEKEVSILSLTDITQLENQKSSLEEKPA